MYDTRATALILTSTGESPATYRWESSGSLWVHGEQSGRSNIFAKSGIGTAGTVFILCRADTLTLHHALLWRGGHYLLTSIEQKNPVTAVINSAKVTVRDCAATRPVKVQDEKGRPKNVQTPLANFPAVLTEKYLRAEQLEPQTAVESLMILVTPKAIDLKTGDLVTVEGVTYAVLICHLTGEWANEYEIVSTMEA